MVTDQIIAVGAYGPSQKEIIEKRACERFRGHLQDNAQNQEQTDQIQDHRPFHAYVDKASGKIPSGQMPRNRYAFIQFGYYSAIKDKTKFDQNGIFIFRMETEIPAFQLCPYSFYHTYMALKPTNFRLIRIGRY